MGFHGTDDTLSAVEGAVELPGSFSKVAVFGGVYSNYLALERDRKSVV